MEIWKKTNRYFFVKMILHRFVHKRNEDFVIIYQEANFARIYMSTFVCVRCGVLRTAPKSANFKSENNLDLPDDNCDFELMKQIMEL